MARGVKRLGLSRVYLNRAKISVPRAKLFNKNYGKRPYTERARQLFARHVNELYSERHRIDSLPLLDHAKTAVAVSPNDEGPRKPESHLEISTSSSRLQLDAIGVKNGLVLYALNTQGVHEDKRQGKFNLPPEKNTTHLVVDPANKRITVFEGLLNTTQMKRLFDGLKKNQSLSDLFWQRAEREFNYRQKGFDRIRHAVNRSQPLPSTREYHPAGYVSHARNFKLLNHRADSHDGYHLWLFHDESAAPSGKSLSLTAIKHDRIPLIKVGPLDNHRTYA